jgi:hypothetical protein
MQQNGNIQYLDSAPYTTSTGIQGEACAEAPGPLRLAEDISSGIVDYLEAQASSVPLDVIHSVLVSTLEYVKARAKIERSVACWRQSEIRSLILALYPKRSELSFRVCYLADF